MNDEKHPAEEQGRRPTEPRTREGRDLAAWLKPWFVHSEDDFDDEAYDQWVAAIIRVEAEAAQGTAPRAERFDRSWWHYADDCPAAPRAVRTMDPNLGAGAYESLIVPSLSEGAAPRAEGLDVRMDWPCSSTREAPGWCVPHDSHWMIENPTCARMRINARLSRPSDESEEPR